MRMGSFSENFAGVWCLQTSHTESVTADLLLAPMFDQGSHHTSSFQRDASSIEPRLFEPTGRLVLECFTRGVVAFHLQPEELFPFQELSPDQGVRVHPPKGDLAPSSPDLSLQSCSPSSTHFPAKHPMKASSISGTAFLSMFPQCAT